jgi:hypothetical protein
MRLDVLADARGVADEAAASDALGRCLVLRAREVVDQLLLENARRWDTASARDRARIRSLAHAVAARVLERPLRVLVDPAWEGDRAEAAWLLGVDELPDVVAGGQSARRVGGA